MEVWRSKVCWTYETAHQSVTAPGIRQQELAEVAVRRFKTPTKLAKALTQQISTWENMARS